MSQGVEIIALRGNIAVFYKRVVQMAIEGFFYAVQVLHNRELPKRDLSLPIQIWQRFLSHAFKNRDRKELTNYLSLPCLRCDLQCKQASWGQVSKTCVSWHHRNPTQRVSYTSSNVFYAQCNLCQLSIALLHQPFVSCVVCSSSAICSFLVFITFFTHAGSPFPRSCLRLPIRGTAERILN